MKKIIVILITTFTLVANAYAGSDGDLILKNCCRIVLATIYMTCIYIYILIYIPYM